MKLYFYLVGTLLTLLGLAAFKLSDKFDEVYLKGMELKRTKGYKKYLKLRKAFLLLSGLVLVIMSIYIGD